MLTPEEMAQTAESLDHVQHAYDHRSTFAERRQQILQRKHSEKQTDALPSYSPETIDDLASLSSPPSSSSTDALQDPSSLSTTATSSATAKVAWRQVVHLREENRRLHAELKSLQSRMQGAVAEKQDLQASFTDQVTHIHSGHLQEIANYRDHLQETMSERNQFLSEYQQLAQRYEQLTQHFEQAVAEATQQRLHDLTPGGSASSMQETAPWLRQMLHTAREQAQQTDDRQWDETLFLKRELQRIVAQFERERTQLNTERQQVAALQTSVREHALQRENVLDARLHARWRVVSIATSLGLLVLLVVLQFISLALFKVETAGILKLALAIPIVICALLAFVLSHPLTFFKHLYLSAPHRVK